MFNIGNYLQKFSSLIIDSKALKRSILSVIYDVIGVELKEKDIDLQKSILYIKTTPLIKNEIYLKKDLILKQLKEKSSLVNITEIR